MTRGEAKRERESADFRQSLHDIQEESIRQRTVGAYLKDKATVGSIKEIKKWSNEEIQQSNADFEAKAKEMGMAIGEYSAYLFHKIDQQEKRPVRKIKKPYAECRKEGIGGTIVIYRMANNEKYTDLLKRLAA